MWDTESDKMNSNLSEYEKKRIINLKRNYEFLKSSGKIIYVLLISMTKIYSYLRVIQFYPISFT